MTLYLFSRPWMWNLAIYNLCWNSFNGIYKLFEVQQPGQNCRNTNTTRVKVQKKTAGALILIPRPPDSPAYGEIKGACSEQMLTISWHCSKQEGDLQQTQQHCSNISLEMGDLVKEPECNKSNDKLIDIQIMIIFH